MLGPSSHGLLLDLLIISGLIGVQLINSVYLVLLSPLLTVGLNPLFLAAAGSLVTSVLVLPFAVAFERKRWPSRLTPTLMTQFVLIGIGGVAATQALMFVGMKKTSPAIASAMPNLIPGSIFIIAAFLGFERVDIRCNYSRAKITGTVVCLVGAVAMSILQSPSAPVPSRSVPSTLDAQSPSASAPFPSVQSTLHAGSGSDLDWIVGCLCLLGTVLIGSCTTVLQATTMINFPAPFTLCAVTSSLGAIFTAMGQILLEGKLDVGSPAISFSTVVATVLLGGSLSSVCIGFQTWAVKKKGPVLASMFSPIQTVCSAFLSAIILGQIIKLESLGGMLAMFLGLYMVLWAMKKEGSILPSSKESSTLSIDIEKPLLS